MTDLVTADDVRAAAQLAVDTLLPAKDRDWSVKPRDLEWTAQETLEHMVGVPGFYAFQLERRATDHPSHDPAALAELQQRRDALKQQAPNQIEALLTTAELLATAVDEAPPDARGFHRLGMADRSGFAAMGCDEILVHTGDLAGAFGLDYDPPSDLCSRVVQRLFPWAPDHDDGWQLLLWCNGRVALPDHPCLDKGWVWHCAPLDEWDGKSPNAS